MGNPHGAVLLEAAYATLGLDQGRLLRPSQVPHEDTRADWEAIGDWLVLASRMDADRLFFVGDDPILVFSAMPEGASELQYIRAYRQAWSLSRPKCLFLASPDELRVYALTSPPPSSPEQWRSLSPLQVVERVADIADALQAFRREDVESGRAFEPDLLDLA